MTFQSLGAGAGFFAINVQTQGSGTVSIDPRAEFYGAGSVVTLAASPARWYGFSQWSDGNASNPRRLTVSEDITLAAVFTNSVPLETTRFKTRQWDRSYGGEGDDRLLFLLPTANDGWILAGDSSSPASDGKTTAGCGDDDFWILKIDRDGQTVWEQDFGGTDRERLTFVQPADGNSFLLGGFSNSGAECTKGEGAFGKGDFWIIKINQNGDKIWERVLGGTGSEQFPVCRPTPDGGAILGGYSDSGISGNKETPGQGGFDYWVIKLSNTGETEWERTLGGSGDDFLSGLTTTADGGFLVTGSSASPADGTKTSPRFGGFDYWVIKLDAAGEPQWDRTYGGTGDDILSFTEARSDGGAVLAGYSNSDAGGNKTAGGSGDYDYWIMRIDSDGNPQWDSAFGGSRAEVLTALLPTGADGFLLGGNSESDSSGNKTSPGYGGTDYWIVKIDEAGNKQWEQSFGGSGEDVLLSLRQTHDGGFVLGGYSSSFRDGNKLLNGLGSADYWIVKCDPDGVREWEQVLGGPDDDVPYSVQETQNGDLICAGYSQSGIGSSKDALQYGGLDYWVVKLVSLELPVGTPLIFVNNQWVPSGGVVVGDLAEIRIQTSFTSGSIFYTLDGSDPGTNSIPYTGPFSTNGSIIVRARSINADQTGSALADPVDVSVLPTYHLNVTTAGGGSISLDPPYGLYLSNSVVTVTAVYDDGWSFLRWIGEDQPVLESIPLTMDRDYSFGAVFGTAVTVIADVNGSARIDPDIPLHPYGSFVRFTAFPKPGFYFSIWEGGLGVAGNANPVELPVTVGDFRLVARFAPLGANQVALVTSIVGAGTVRSDPQKDVYDIGDTVTLTATASDGAIFVGWDQDESGYTNPLTVQMDQSRTIRAKFMTPGFHVDASSFVAGGFRLALVVQAGGAFQIDRSSDLINWTPMMRVNNSPPLIYILDPGPTSAEARYYRFNPLP